jgi:hypothetical protein
MITITFLLLVIDANRKQLFARMLQDLPVCVHRINFFQQQKKCIICEYVCGNEYQYLPLTQPN